ncbi:MAG: helicase-related protein [Acidilobaceae archaeon]
MPRFLSLFSAKLKHTSREVFLASVIYCGELEVRVLSPKGYGVYISDSLLRELTGESSGAVAVYPEISFRANPSSFDLCEAARRVVQRERVVYVVTRALAGGSAVEEIYINDYPEAPVERLVEEVERHFVKLLSARGLRPWQRRLAELVLEKAGRGGLVVARLPTGYGKTVLLTLLARVMSSNGLGGYGLIVSPLRAIIRNQYLKSSKLGLRVAFIDSTLSPDSRARILEETSRGLVDVLMVTPERFLDDSFRSFLENNPPSFIALDEAHAVVEWSLTFRPAYLYLLSYLAKARREKLGKTPLVAVSGTLARSHTLFIVEKLGFKSIQSVGLDSSRASSNSEALLIEGEAVRRDIELDVRIVPAGRKRLEELEEEVEKLVSWARSRSSGGAGIVYVGFVENAPVEWLNAKVVAETLSRSIEAPLVLYHGALRESERRKVEEFLLSDATPREVVVVATKAFGMGVDVPHIRWVVHYTLSDSIEDFCQEIGRAGRDGRGARAVVFYNPLDFELKRRLVVSEVLPATVPLRVYNTVAELSRKTGERAVSIPLELAGSKARTIKGLDKLREAGLVDFTIAKRRNLIHKPTPLLSENTKFYVCRSSAQDLYPLRIEARERVVEVGYCDEWVLATGDLLAVVELLSGVEKLHAPTLDLLLATYSEAAWRLSKLDELQSLIEEAVKVGEQRLLDLLEDYFDRRRELGAIADCRRLLLEESGKTLSLRELESLAALVKKLVLCLSRRGVTIATRRRRLAASLLTTLREKLGARDQPRLVPLSRLYKISRETVRLSSHGYLVVLVDSERDLEKAVRALERYPFKTLAYLQH